MTNFDINELAALAKEALKKQELGQEYLLSDVHNITRQAYEQYTEDTIIRQFAFVIERKTEREGPHSTINQREMTGIYNDISRLGSTERFRSVLGALVNSEESEVVRTNDEFVRMNRLDAEDTGLSTEDYIDSNLVNALEGAFGGNIPKQETYDVKAASKGAEFLQLELESLGFKSRVEVLGGNNDTLVYAAHLDTQNGLVSVAIPLDISQGKVLLPSTFVADDHLENLTSSSLRYFIDKKAYVNDFSMPNVNAVLKAVGIMTGRDVAASDKEFHTTLERFDERGETVHINTPELFTKQQNSAPQSYIDTTPDVQMPQELAHLAQDFENDLLEVASSFGKEAVQAGRQMLSSELAVAGFKNAQVKYGSEDNDSIIYLVAFHTSMGPSEIAVPVEMCDADGRRVPLAPTSFTWQGKIGEFTAANIQRFAAAHVYSGVQVASVSHTHMNISELKGELLKSVAASDYQVCEMILGTVNERFGEDVYKNIVADYHYVLALKHNHEQEERQVCSKKIAAGKGSINDRCGCFGVSMDKVVVGKDGHCRLKTALERERLNPADKGGAAISTSKLFLT